MAIVWGFALTACVTLAEALLQWKFQGTSNKAGNAAAVLFIFIFVVIVQVCVSLDVLWTMKLIIYKGIDAPSFVWASEIYPTNIRAKGISLLVFSYFTGTITFSTPAPVALISM